MVTFEAKIKKVGGSLSIVIPSFITKMKNLEDKELVSITLEKQDPAVNGYLCSLCNYAFSSTEDNVYCPNCGCEDKEVIKLLEEEK